MNIYLCTDMEGCSGVARWEDCAQQTPGWEYGRRMLTQDVKATVEGFQAGGADRIVVSDGHGGGANLLMEDLPAGAEYICGRGGGSRALPFLDETFDAVGLIGQHAKARTPDAFLPHTQSSVNWLGLWANGREIGELGQVALIAGHFDVPVILVTGDRAVGIEAHDLLGEHVETVTVKQACSPTRGLCMALDDAHGAIREGAKRSLANIGKAKPFKTDLPMEIKIRYNSTAMTEGPVASGAELFDPLTTRRVVETQLEIYTV